MAFSYQTYKYKNRGQTNTTVWKAEFQMWTYINYIYFIGTELVMLQNTEVKLQIMALCFITSFSLKT